MDFENILKLNFLYKLKEIDRAGSVQDRFESSAEHVYSSLILFEFLKLKLEKYSIDFEKVRKMILYHDLVEIEGGDTFILDDNKLEDQNKREEKAFKNLTLKVPEEMKGEILSLIEEQRKGDSIESKVVNVIDAIDPMIHSISRKSDWKKYKFTESKLREKKQKIVSEFPETLEFFEKLIDFFRENDYFYS